MIEGVDFSDARPGGAALAAAQKRFVARYVPYGGYAKGLTKAEIADYHAHGLAIVLVWEQFANRALSGRQAGVADANTVKAATEGLGFPATLPIYFAVDFDAQPIQLPLIDNYLRGAASVLGSARIGVYGGLRVVSHAKAAGTARWFWQTLAWSGGVVAPGIDLYQYSNDHVINGGSVDLDRALQTSYGQWAPGTQGGVNVPGGIMLAPITDTSHGTVKIPGGEARYLEDGVTPDSVKTVAATVWSPFGTKTAVGTLRAFAAGAAGSNVIRWAAPIAGSFVQDGTITPAPTPIALGPGLYKVGA